MNVFDIVNDYESLIDEIEELGGEITPEIAEKLNINAEQLSDKVHAYYFVIKTKDAEITLMEDEITRLKDKIKAKEGVIKRLKKTVDLAVETFGELKPSGAKGLKYPDLNVWQKKTEALNIVEGGMIDDERFCVRKYLVILPYNKEEQFCTAIKNIDFSDGVLKAEIGVNNTVLKQWVIDNESYLKQLKDAAEDIEPEIESDRITPLSEEEIKREEEMLKQEQIDTKIALVASIAHNSTVIFK